MSGNITNKSGFYRYQIGVFAVTLALLTFSLSPLSRSKVHAAQKNNSVENKITVSPVIYELEADPGSLKTFYVNIENANSYNLEVNISFAGLDYETFVKENRLELDEDSKLGSWLSAERDSFILKKNESRSLKINLQIPSDADLGGEYPAVIYSFKSKEVKKNLSIVGRSTTFIYLNVPQIKGESVIYELDLVLFDVLDKVVFSPKADFKVNVVNNGNSFAKPRGKIYIFDSKGKNLSNTLTINDNYSTLIPGKSIDEQLRWDRGGGFKLIPDFGKYKAEVVVFADPDQSRWVSSEVTFYVIPIWHLAALLVILAAVSFVFVLIRKKRL
ncbi:MAG: hypothetical protein PHS44_04785 [Candidatus Dojkabacteria bacterium]|nr:hypothetical protein [Candidatus Dojkabacteria bacterium]